jgi:hypothetical protein
MTATDTRTSQVDVHTLAAEQVVAETVEAARATFGSGIEAIFTLGSLAHGGFAPLVSDVDVAIVLGSTSPTTGTLIDGVARSVAETASSPLSQRLSVFWGDWRAVRTGEGDCLRLGPVDRLDLLESGCLLVGADLREPSIRPSTEELVLMSADHMLGKFTVEYLEQMRDAETLIAGGPRAVTKAILFPVRFAYTLGTGRIGLNETSARWYADQGFRGGGLALRALNWRREGINDAPLAHQMLDADLLAIHADCLAGFAEHLDTLGETARAVELSQRADWLRLPAPDA